MAEGLLNSLSVGHFVAESAGTEQTLVRPLAIQALAELGIDISHHTSKTLNQFLDQEFDFVVTVCDNANEACPLFRHGKQRHHWSFTDPSKAVGSEEEQLQAYRVVRDQIKEKIMTVLLLDQ
ncbi:hypothetical protein HDU98_007787 [Podochytrium sp. JEL0797]|nr:hypothetical protein HDU98_007787 [Podochytrium sp. JEL0797]